MPLTVPRSPALQSRERRRLALQSKDGQLAAEKEQRRLKSFRARPATVLQQPPFVPEKRVMPIDVRPFKFASERRVAERGLRVKEVGGRTPSSTRIQYATSSLGRRGRRCR